MTLKQILDIEKALGRKLPVDMYSSMSYFDTKKDKYIDVLQLDIVEAIRILRKKIREGKILQVNKLLNRNWTIDGKVIKIF